MVQIDSNYKFTKGINGKITLIEIFPIKRAFK